MSALDPVHIGSLSIPFAWLAVGLLGIAAILEAGYLLARRRRYDLGDALTNVAMYAGHLAVLMVWAPCLFVLYDVLHAHALFDLGPESSLAARAAWLPWLVLFLAEDLCFYVFHRSSHRVRLLWVSHENHHTSERFNFSVALRQTWTPFLAVLFWLPLPLLGFPPLMVLSAQVFSLSFQAFLHTELVGTLGPVGLLFNTPGHHRIHHGVDEACVDKNFGGVLIVWDRLFGSFHRGAPAAYGIGEQRGHQPIAVAFVAWRSLAVDLWRSRSVSDALAYLLRAPGWQPRSTRIQGSES